jgi:integrase/recombinase XerD
MTEKNHELARIFYENILQLGYNNKTARSKWQKVKCFFYFIETTINPDITAITKQDILNFYQNLLQRKNVKTKKLLQQKTAVEYIRAVQDLYRMLQQQSLIKTNPTSTIQLKYPKPEGTRNTLSTTEIKELYKACETFLEKAILALGYGCGLRVSEMVQCNIDDLKLRENYIIVPKGKGNKTRTVPLSKTVVKDLSNYLYKVRLMQENKDTKALILHSKLNRMQKWTFNKTLKNLIEKTENKTLLQKQITIHNLRHSIATHLIEQGMPLENVRDFLGHAQLETTEIYTHINQIQLRKLVVNQEVVSQKHS